MTEPEPGPIDFKLLLSEIEMGSSGSIANVIRKLREHEAAAYRAGVGGPIGNILASFIPAMDSRTDEISSEIENTCAHYYQGFVEATRDLLGVQDESTSVQSDIKVLDEELEEAVTNYSASCKELSDCKTTLEHVDQCIEALQLTLPILDQYQRIEQSIADGRFYHALHTLEDLEHIQLIRLRQYAFSEVLSQRIPKIRAHIKNASLAELTDFLEHIRKHSIRLGAITMYETAESTGMDANALMKSARSVADDSSTISKEKSNASSVDVSSLRKRSVTRSVILEKELEELHLVTEGGTLEDESSTSIGDAQSLASEWNQSRIRTEDLVDFGPVYRCLHIHTALNERSEFERYYCAQRRKQCQLNLSLTVTQQAHIRNYGEFFGSICGFFVVDDYLRHTLPGSSAAYQTYLDELWGNAVERLVEFARANAGDCNSANDLIQLKDYTVLFNRSMSRLGFPTSGLSEMITWIQRRYQRLLAGQWRDKFEQILQKDTFSPIEIKSPVELTKLSNLYPACITAEFDALPYPRQLCFSWMVPHIYKAVKEYIDLCGRFCAHVDLAYSEFEDTVNRATNALFTDCLNEVLHAHVRQSKRAILRLTQLCTNLDELETVCGHLDVYLQQLTRKNAATVLGDPSKGGNASEKLESTDSDPIGQLNTGANPPRSRLHGASLLKEIRGPVESMIYDHLSDCVDEFVGRIDYSNLTPSNQTNGSLNEKIELKPNEHIVQLISWLSSTFRAFANIPPKVAQTACMTVCKRIAGALYDLLLNPQACEFSELSVLQLSTDLSQCESFVRSQPVPGLGRNVLGLIFTDLRQLLDLFRRDDWAVYFSAQNDGENSPYYRVSPSVAIKLLERVRDAEKKRGNLLNSMSKEKRERRKKIDDVIRQLRDIVVNPRR